jgi:hypothetical protein
LTSDDGQQWEHDIADVVNGGDDDRLLRGVCVGDSSGDAIVVAVGGSGQGRVLRSADGGAAWSSVVDDRGWIGACAFGVVDDTPQFVFVGSARSDRSLDGGQTLVDHANHFDGSSWHMRDVVFVAAGALGDGRARFVAVGDRGISQSFDGVSWSNPVGPSGLFRVAVGAGRLVAVGGGVLATSTDATTWTTQPGGVTGGGNDIHYADGRFLVVGEGYRLTSTDGLAWSRASQLALGRVTAGVIDGVTVWLGANWPDARFRSLDGVDWTPAGRDNGNAIDDLVFVPR